MIYTNLFWIFVQKHFKNDPRIYELASFFWRHPQFFPSYSYYLLFWTEFLKHVYHYHFGLIFTTNVYNLVHPGKVFVIECLLCNYFCFLFGWLQSCLPRDHSLKCMHSLLFFTFSHFIDWMYWDRSGRKIPGCLSVCLYLCVCLCVCSC